MDTETFLNHGRQIINDGASMFGKERELNALEGADDHVHMPLARATRRRRTEVVNKGRHVLVVRLNPSKYRVITRFQLQLQLFNVSVD
jgi:hypothetical protein